VFLLWFRKKGKGTGFEGTEKLNLIENINQKKEDKPMTIIRWHNRPRFSSMLDEMLERNLPTGFEKNCGCEPATNIREDEKQFEIQLAAPGMKKEDFSLQMENNVLAVSYEKKEKDDENNQGENFLRREFGMDSFTRSFSIPKNTAAENISARYEQGILFISVPKLEPEKARLSRSIEIA
jgi:HSP20 family protein